MQATSDRSAPRTVRQKGQHFVMFYEKDGFLVDEVGKFIGSGLRAGDTGIVIVSAPHREALENRLRTFAADAGGRAAFPGHLVLLDARETLSRFMLDDRPDPARFTAVLGAALEQAARGPSGRVRAFGEMVALLWEDGKRSAAIELENLWNQLAESHAFSLFCAYPLHAFSRTEDAAMFRHVCDTHTHVHQIQDQSPSREDRLNRELAELQQKSQALETEVARRRQLEHELEQKLALLAEMDRRKDEFIAMLGHELRNPLAPITTSLCLMRLQSGDAAAVTRSREVIERQVALMTRLVNDLLDVSRIAHGKIKLKKEMLRLDSIVEQALEMNRPLISRLGHRIVLDLPRRPFRLHGDPARLGQALANLIDNAARYTERGGEIRLAARSDAGHLLLSVKDNGSGLDAGLRERAFDLFTQGGNAPSHTHGGLGVGLTLARAIIDLHGGSISAVSDGPGCGSEFTVTLPLPALPESAALPQESDPPGAASVMLEWR